MVQTDRIEGLETSMAIKSPVKMATTANITLSGVQDIDGVTGIAGDRVLVKDQDTGTEDGIYLQQTALWTRAGDWDGSRDATQGTLVSVKQGTINADSVWRSTSSDDPYAIGSTTSPAFALAEFFATVSGDMKYNFDSDTTVSEDPGTGDFRLNNATVASATVMSFSASSADPGSPDMSDFIVTWDDSTNTSLRGIITIKELGAPEIFAAFSVNATITDGTSYLDVPISYVNGAGSFTASSGYVVSFSRTGDIGTLSALNMLFESATTDTDQGAGKTWLNNATVSSATVLYMDDVENAAGASINSFVDSWDDSTNTALRGAVTITKQGNAAVFAIFNVTGPVTSASTYSKVAVTYVTGAGSFSDGDVINVQFVRTGDKGADGAGSGDMLGSNNLSDVDTAATALSNIGGIGAATSDTLTNKTFDANGTGNSLANVDVADLAVGTDGQLITWDSSGNPVVLTGGVGTDGQFLQSNGAGAEPSFETLSAGGFTLATPQATTSGTTKTFGSIPAGTTMIVISFEGVSFSGAAVTDITIGDSGGLETSGYVGAGAEVETANSALTTSTAEFIIKSDGSAANTLSGIAVLTLLNASTFTWSFSHSLGFNTNRCVFGGGVKSLSAELTQLQISGGTFDAGSINIMYQ